MSTFNKLLGAAAKALGDRASSSSSSSSSRSTPSRSGTDWRDLVRSAASTITGDSRDDRDHRTGSAAPSGSTRPQDARTDAQRPAYGTPAGTPAPASAADRRALAEYDYLLTTAPPGRLEEVHREAFARLTPEQRRQLESGLRDELPEGERPASSSPDDLARAATRGEVNRPGLMKKVLSGAGSKAVPFAAGAAAGVGVAAVGGLALAVAGGAAVSAVAGPLLAEGIASGIDFDAAAEGLTGDLAGGVTEGLGGVSEGLGGISEQLGSLGEGFQLPGLGDFFDR